MIRKLYTFASALALLFVAGACMPEELVSEFNASPVPSDEEGVDLFITVDVDELMSSLDVNPGTRADGDIYDPEMNAIIDNIASLAFFIVEKNAPYRMRAFRLIAPPDDKESNDVAGGYYLDKDPRTGVIDNTTVIIPRTERIERHFGSVNPTTGDIDYDEDVYDDDQHYGCWGADGALDPTCVGYNGYAAMDGMNNTKFEDYGGVKYPMLDKDGMYDDSFVSGDYREYAEGKPMRKSGAIILSFKYDKPMHGPIEKLTRGDYYLLAIANFRESISSVATKSYSYTPELNDLFEEQHDYIGTYIHDLLWNWDPVNGLPPQKYNGFINGAVSLSEVSIEAGRDGNLVAVKENGVDMENPFIRSNRARIIMSGYEDIVLTPGNSNVYTFDLTRSVARVTFRVKNYSSEQLTVSDFSLSDNFAQAATYIFHNPAEHGKLFNPLWQGSPKVTDSKAIVPFVNNTTLDRLETKTFFDALIYESGSTVTPAEPMKFNITVSYPGTRQIVDNKLEPTELDLDGLNSELSSLTRDGDEIMLVLKSHRQGYFVKYSDDAKEGMTKSSVSDMNSLSQDIAFRKDFIWKLIRTTRRSTQGYIIESVYSPGSYLRMKNDYVLDDPNKQALKVLDYVTDPTKATLFQIAKEEKTNNFVFKKADSNDYIHATNSGFSWKIGWMSTWHNDGGFTAYKVKFETRTENNIITKENEPINVFNMNDGIASPLYNIHRNDHIIVDIGVTYNVDTQDIQFKVEPWKGVDNEVEFE